MYPLMHYRSHELPAGIAGQIMMMFSLVMNADAASDDRFADPFSHSEHFDHFVVVERRLLISHADVSQRTITHAGATFRLGCVGEVMTHPAFRHAGHGHRAVAAATELILNSPVDVGMLFTSPDLEPFYAANGWAAVRPDPGITFGDPVQPHFDAAFVMMQFVSAHGKTHRDDFAHGPIYVGKAMW